MSTTKAKRNRIVVLVVLLVLALFFFFGENSPIDALKETPLAKVLHEFTLALGIPEDKKVLTTPLEKPLASVHLIDVGQGESLLLRLPEGDVLIDGGLQDQGTQLVDYLQRTGVTRLELVVATHPHADHIGGLTQVLAAFPVGQVLLPEIPQALLPTSGSFLNFLKGVDSQELLLVSPEFGSSYELGQGATLSFYSPQEAPVDVNNLSLFVRLDVGEVSFLFTGDAEKWGEEQLLKSGAPLKADVLGIGHHGSTTSTSPAFLKKVSPQIALISCGMDNPYGHPHTEVLRDLVSADIDIYRTDLDGTVVVETDGVNIAVVTEVGEVELVA